MQRFGLKKKIWTYMDSNLIWTFLDLFGLFWTQIKFGPNLDLKLDGPFWTFFGPKFTCKKRVGLIWTHLDLDSIWTQLPPQANVYPS